MENLLSFNTINNIKYYLGRELINLFRTLDEDQLSINRKINQMIESSEKSISLNKLVSIQRFIEYSIKTYNQDIISTTNEIISELKSKFEISERILFSTFQELTKSSPFAAFLNNGVLVKKGEEIIDSVEKLQRKDEVKLIFKDGEADSSIEKIQKW
jgi:exodeoxyribonuclease VII large subunit